MGGGGGGGNHLIMNVGLYLTVVDKAINHDQWWDISHAHTMHCAGCIKPHPHSGSFLPPVMVHEKPALGIRLVCTVGATVSRGA